MGQGVSGWDSGSGSRDLCTDSRNPGDSASQKAMFGSYPDTFFSFLLELCDESLLSEAMRNILAGLSREEPLIRGAHPKLR